VDVISLRRSPIQRDIHAILTHSRRAYVDEARYRNAGHPTIKGVRHEATYWLCDGDGNARQRLYRERAGSSGVDPIRDSYNASMLTIFLKHDETRPLAELKPAGESAICGLLGPVGRRSAHGTGSGESLS
jgi:hypothetical protein